MPKTKNKKKDADLRVRLLPSLLASVAKAADAKGETVSEFIRHLLMREALKGWKA